MASLIAQMEWRYNILLDIAPNIQSPPAYFLGDTDRYCREGSQLVINSKSVRLDMQFVIKTVESWLVSDRAMAEQHLQWTHAFVPVDECSSNAELLTRLAFRGVLQSHNDITLDPLTASPWSLLIKQVQRINSDLRRSQDMLVTSQLPPEVLQISLEALGSLHVCLTRYQRLLQIFERDFREWQIFYWQSQFALRELQRIAKASDLEWVVGEKYFGSAVIAIAVKIFRAVKRCRENFGEYYPNGQNLNYRGELLNLFETKSGAQTITNVFLHQRHFHKEYQRALRQEYGTLENAFATELPGLFVEALAPVPLHDDPFRFALDFEEVPAAIKVIANRSRRGLKRVQYGSDSTQSALVLETAPSLSCGINKWIAQEKATAELRDLFAKLPKSEQRVFKLRKAGLSQKEIASRLNIGIETVNECLDRIRKRASGQLPPSRAWRKAHGLSQRETK